MNGGLDGRIPAVQRDVILVHHTPLVVGVAASEANHLVDIAPANHRPNRCADESFRSSSLLGSGWRGQHHVRRAMAELGRRLGPMVEATDFPRVLPRHMGLLQEVTGGASVSPLRMVCSATGFEKLDMSVPFVCGRWYPQLDRPGDTQAIAPWHQVSKTRRREPARLPSTTVVPAPRRPKLTKFTCCTPLMETISAAFTTGPAPEPQERRDWRSAGCRQKCGRRRCASGTRCRDGPGRVRRSRCRRGPCRTVPPVAGDWDLSCHSPWCAP